MKGRAPGILAGIAACTFALFGAGAWYVSGSSDFCERAAALVTEKATESLGSRVKVGSLRVDSIRSLTADDIAVYDKNDNIIARAESATARFSFLGVFGENPVKGIDEVLIDGFEANIKRDQDGRWNYEDLLSDDSEPTGFTGKVTASGGTLTLSMPEGTILAEDAAGTIDFKDADAPHFSASAKHAGAHVSAEGVLGSHTEMSVTGESLSVENYLGWLPEGTIPDDVVIKSGLVEQLSMDVKRDGSEVSVKGKARLKDGAARVFDTEVDKVSGTVDFTESDMSLDAKAAAAGQEASARGVVSMADGTMDIIAESEAFDPSKVMTDIPFQGAVGFTANITGTFESPEVVGVFTSAAGSVYGYDFSDAVGRAAYSGGRIELQTLTAVILGGDVSAEGEFDPSGQRFSAHVLANGIDVSGFGEFLPGVSGVVTADVAFSGEGMDASHIKVYGSAEAREASYEGVRLAEAAASFYHEGDVTRIDSASARLTEGGEISAEGTVSGGETLDLTFYGSRVNLGVVRSFMPDAKVSGISDFTVKAVGSLSNPEVSAEFSAIDGKLFEQPYRSLAGKAGGSLDGISVESFSMENGGEKPTWLVKGVVGLTGERNVDIQIDTIGARMEDIATLIAPDQPITGDIDNIVKITGTLDDPSIVGYVSSHRGSYNGYLLSGMEGDYTFDKGVLNVIDFHIYSPLVDMDLNGTLDASTESLAMKVAVHDVDLARFARQLPYPIEGHGKFDGEIGGTIKAPTFDGRLSADEMIFNGASVNDAHGTVSLRGSRVSFEPFGFTQNEGTYSLRAFADLDRETLSGRIDVQNGDINALMAMGNLKNDALFGRVDASIVMDGTLSDPMVGLSGRLDRGDFRGYPLENFYFDCAYSSHALTIKRLEGHQGQGVITGDGVFDMAGRLDGSITAKNIDAGLIAAAAGIGVEFTGAVDIGTKIGGTFENPAADATLSVTGGGVGGSSVDEMRGSFSLRDGIISVNELVAKKADKERMYGASASGTVPLRAITAALGEPVSSDERINLTIFLDDADLGMLPILTKAVTSASGETEGSVTIGGTLAAPSFDGAVLVKNGSIKLKDLKKPFTDVSFGLNFAGNRISIRDGSSAKLGDGTLTLAGSLALDGLEIKDYSARVAADKLDVESGFYKGPFTASFDLDEGEWYGGRKLPRLSGRIDLDNVVISIPSIPDSEGELPEVMLDVGIDVGKRTHFYSANLYDMWLTGAIHYGGTTLHPQQSGSVRVRRGKIQYLQTPFRVTEGEAYFNQVGSFLPSISFKSEARMDRTRINLDLDGPLLEMKLGLSSSPEMSREEILKLLTMRGAYKSGDPDSGDAEMNALIAAGLQMSVLGEVQDAVKDFLQLDEFSLSTGTFRDDKKSADRNTFEAYNIQIGKYITDKIMLQYTQGIDHDFRRYNVRYDFDDRFSVFVGRNENSHDWLGALARINF